MCFETLKSAMQSMYSWRIMRLYIYKQKAKILSDSIEIESSMTHRCGGEKHLPHVNNTMAAVNYRKNQRRL